MIRTLLLLCLFGGIASAAPLRVVVRHGGGDELVLSRLAGQVSDLDVEAVPEDGALEATLDAQIAAAGSLAAADDARVIVWFRSDGGAIVIAVAMPADRRVLVRTIDAGDASATAEAAAEAVRTALRAIADGGTIGVSVPAAADVAPRWRWEGAAGWQVAADDGADVGAHAIWQRLGAWRGRWGGSLALSIGPPLRRAGTVDVDLSRSSVIFAGALRRGRWRFGLGAGVAIYHRATVGVPSGLMATDAQLQAALDVAPEVRIRLPWRLELSAGVDVIAPAPAFAVDRGGVIDTISKIAILQPRLALGIVVGP